MGWVPILSASKKTGGATSARTRVRTPFIVLGCYSGREVPSRIWGFGEDDMWKILRRAKVFLRSEEAATATEYAVMIALVIIVVMAAVAALGEKVSSEFANAEQQWTAVNP
jgi:pilus assembly protein Flp/PilA